ncbi:hypothetical protein FRC07_002674, partial [Ceratobasidium sp. 392]
DDTGEELPASFQEQANRLTQDLHVQTQNSARKDEIIASLERDAEGNRQLLAKLTTDLAQKDQELVEKNKVIRQLQQGAKDKEEAVSRVGKEDEEMLHLRKQQVQLEIDLSQQKVETASLQGKMDRVEYLMARMSRSDDAGEKEADPIEGESKIGQLRRELAEQRAQLVLRDQEIAEKDQQLAEQAVLLSQRESLDKDRTLAEIRKEIGELHGHVSEMKVARRDSMLYLHELT